MSRILYVLPLVGLSEEEKKRRENLANSFLTHEKNSVVVEQIEKGPLSIESSVEGSMSVPGILKKLNAVQDHYDAAVIGCAGDPGLVPARELVDIPIIGPLEASLHVACQVGETFSVIPSSFPSIVRTVRSYGMEQRLASSEGIPVTVLDMATHKDEVVNIFIQKAKKAVETDRASSIVIGCMSLAFLLIDELVKNEVHVPIINPAKISIKMAEMFCSLGLTQSRVSFAKPNAEKLHKSHFF